MATAVANAKAYLEGVNSDMSKFAPNLVATNIAPSFSFTQSEYIAPPTRATLLSSGQVIDPRTKAQIDWSAGQDAERQAGIKTLADKAAADKAAQEEAARQASIKAALSSQANLEASAQNAGYQGYLEDPAAMQSYLDSEKVSVQDYTGNYAKQQAIDKAAAEQKAIEDARLAALARNPDGGPSSVAPSNNITYGPQQVTLNPSAVVQSPSPLSSNISSAQTVALPPSGPSSYPQVTVNPTPAQNAGIVGTIDPATLSVANMNSNAGGLPSLMGPFQNTVQSQTQPAVNYTYAPSSQQQLEDQAINAGYQGDYSDTAAMQGYVNSNAGGVASLVSPQGTVQPQPAVIQQPVGVSGNTSPLSIPKDTRVFDTAGNVVAGKRKLIF